ncbi:MAG: aspartyl protease family protein [Methanobacteriota archaeon]
MRATVRAFSQDGGRSVDMRLIVDTGSTLTWIPSTIAQRLGIRPTDVVRFRTIDGTYVERPVGDAPVECAGRRGVIGIVFAREGDAEVLGVTALERLGLQVDPETGSLRKVDAYLALAT